MRLPEVRARALARFETPAQLAAFLADQVRARLGGAGLRACDPWVVLDPTCGSGALLTAATACGAVAYGVDLDPAAAERAAAALGTVPGGRVKVGNALLDPVGAAQWPAFRSSHADLLDQAAHLRDRGHHQAAETLLAPLRAALMAALPPALRDQRPFCWPLEFPEVFAGGSFDAIVTNPPWDKLKLHSRECFDPAFRRMHESDQRRAREQALRDAGLRREVEAEREALTAFRALLTDRASCPGRGDRNAYLAVLALCDALLGPGGALGAILPGGCWTDLSALPWRDHLLADYTAVATWGFEARADVFPAIDQRTAVVVGRKLRPGERPDASVSLRGGLRRQAELSGGGLAVSVALIRATAPESLAFPTLGAAGDAAVVEQLYRAGPPFGTGPWRPAFGREVDMTADADVFDGVREGAPLWEGKRIGAFELCPVDAVAAGAWPACSRACTRARSCAFRRRNGQQLWVDESRLGPRDRGHAAHARVAWRSVARADRARRLEAALVPAGYRLGNSLNYLVGDRHTLAEKLTLLAYLNSLVVEWRLRHLAANNNVNLYVVRQLPVPPGPAPDLAFQAARLMLAFPPFSAEARSMGAVPATDPAERSGLRADLEARVAHRFGLSAPDLSRILAAFPKLEPGTASRILAAHARLPEPTCSAR